MFANMKLGRINRPLPPNLPDFRDHAIATATAPVKLDRSHVPYRPEMGGNDRLGDCTAAALANTIIAQAALSGYQDPIPTQKIIDFYSQSCGYVPGDPNTDQGGVEVDVLAYQQRHGFDIGQQVPMVGLWGNIDKNDLNLVRLIAARLGSTYLGVSLAIADQTNAVWDTNTPTSQGDPTPGSWGGHALVIFDYAGIADTDTVRLATWGTLQKCTWRWLRSRMDEAHGIWHPQLAKPNHRNFAGIDIAKLEADNAAFTNRVIS